MKLKDIINKSVYGAAATFLSKENADMFLRYFAYNKPFLSKFPSVLFAINGKKEYFDEVSEILKKELNTINTIYVDKEGHTFGTFFLDNSIFEYTKQLTNIDWLWKSSYDVIVNDSIVWIDIDDADFYYINNLGYYHFIKYKCNQEDVFSDMKSGKLFYPQSNYYIIKSGLDFYPSKEKIEKLLKIYNEKKSPHSLPWDVIEGCDCETFLKEMIERNKLTKKLLLNDEEIRGIIKYVYDNREYDGSHKNVCYTRLGNLCHFHLPDKGVIAIP